MAGREGLETTAGKAGERQSADGQDGFQGLRRYGTRVEEPLAHAAATSLKR